MKLNPAQRRAVIHEGGPVLVLAGAGSGKTGVITQRIAWLIAERNVKPEHIFAVTFTNKAAREMKQRVSRLLADAAISSRISISTFHRLGLRMIGSECENAGLKPGFSIIDPADSKTIVADLLQREFAMDPAQADTVSQAISNLKNSGGRVDSKTQPMPVLTKICDAYQRYLRACNAVDLDDMIAIPGGLLTAQTDVLNRWRSRIRYLMVDEYQDTNAAQYELVRLLSGAGRGLMVVGDDDQSIYGWRGAMPENLKQLGTDFSDLQVIKLEQNYRSRGRILKLANQLITHNVRPFEKSLWSDLGFGDPIKVFQCDNEVREAERVVSELMSERFHRRSRFGDFAILYRGNYQARILEQKLMEMQVPYVLSGGLSFFDRTEIRDIMAYLRIITNPADDSALLRIVNTPRRGIGAATLEKVGEYALGRRMAMAKAIHESGAMERLGARASDRLKQFSSWLRRYQEWAGNADISELISGLLDDTAYRQWLCEQSDNDEIADRRWQNVQELIEWVERLARRDQDGVDLGEVVRRLTLADMLDRQNESDERQDKVGLMTLHAAKGLEFDNVFIVGVEEGILPHANSQSDDGIQEERRLFYVGITRARRNLSFSFASRRRRYGTVIDCRPSRFLDELPSDDLEWKRPEHSDSEESRKSGKAHLAGIRAILSAT